MITLHLKKNFFDAIKNGEKNLKCYLKNYSWINNDHFLLYQYKVNECYDLKKYPWFICLEIEPVKNFN